MSIIDKLEAIVMDNSVKSPFKIPNKFNPETPPGPKPPAIRQSVEGILTERNSTHGDFADNARLSQSLKSHIFSSPNAATLNDVQREALEMICLKLSRILSGNANEIDHWHDIAGYAKLVANTLR